MHVRGSALVQALRNYTSGHAQPPKDELRARVNAVVDAALEEDWTCVRAILAVKQAAAHAGVVGGRHYYARPGSPEKTDQLLAELVSWTIDHYYERHADPPDEAVHQVPPSP